MPLTSLQQSTVNSVAKSGQASLTALYESENGSSPAPSASGGTAPTPIPYSASIAGQSSNRGGGSQATYDPNVTAANGYIPSVVATNAALAGSNGGGTPSTYFPRSNPGSSAPSAVSSPASGSGPVTADDFFADVYSKLSPVLAGINDTEAAAEQGANIASRQATSGMNVALGAYGLGGSSQGDAAAAQVEQQRQQTILAAKGAQETAIGALVEFAVPEAATEYNAAIANPNSQAYVMQTQVQLKNALVGIAGAGVSLSDLQSSNPQEYATLLQYAGGDPNNLNNLFIAASQSLLLNNGQPLTTTGNSYIYGIKSIDANGNPTIKTIVSTIPAGTPSSYKMITTNTTALGGVMTQYAPVGLDGTTISDPSQVKTYLNGQQVAGPGTPPGQNITTVTGGGDAIQAYVDGIKNGTITSIASVPAQFKSQVAIAMDQQGISSPLADSRFTNAVNRIASNFINLPGYQLTANGLPYLQRIQAAEQTPGSISDQDLLDSLTKLNTSGNAISDAQVSLITQGQSYSDWASVIKNKLGTGGVLSDDQRSQIQTIAKAIYANYQQGYQPVYDQVTKQLTAAGIPPEYWTIPDLNALSAGQTGDTQGGSSMYPAGSVVQDSSGNKYTVGADGETLTPQ